MSARQWHLEYCRQSQDPDDAAPQRQIGPHLSTVDWRSQPCRAGVHGEVGGCGSLPVLPQPAMPMPKSGHLPPEATTPDTVDTDIQSGRTFRFDCLFDISNSVSKMVAFP